MSSPRSVDHGQEWQSCEVSVKSATKVNVSTTAHTSEYIQLTAVNRRIGNLTWLIHTLLQRNSGGNPVSKHQIQPEYGDEQADAGRDG